MNIRHLLAVMGLAVSTACFSQFDKRQENKIKLEEDSAKLKDPNIVEFERVHFGPVIGYHQGINPELEIGFHKTFTDSDKLSSSGLSASYLRNLNEEINSLAISGWFGLVGINLKTNTKDFQAFSYSIQPILGLEHRFLHLFYGYNFNIDSYRTTTLNTHTLSLRMYLFVITKKGRTKFHKKPECENCY